MKQVKNGELIKNVWEMEHIDIFVVPKLYLEVLAREKAYYFIIIVKYICP
jgi:hypothetical protein